MKDKNKKTTSLTHALVKLVFYLLVLAGFLLIIGFLVFASKISKSTIPTILPKADGIVVLTGSDGQRLENGAKLLAEGKGERLFISGVNSSVNSDEIKKLLGLDDKQFDCCVDLDFEAKNTFDNGRETAIWVRSMDYESIILVTSDYHMPRARIELNSALGATKIIPYPIKTKKQNAPWWGGRDRMRLLVREYGKLLVRLAKDPGARPAAKPSHN